MDLLLDTFNDILIEVLEGLKDTVMQVSEALYDIISNYLPGLLLLALISYLSLFWAGGITTEDPSEIIIQLLYALTVLLCHSLIEQTNAKEESLLNRIDNDFCDTSTWPWLKTVTKLFYLGIKALYVNVLLL